MKTSTHPVSVRTKLFNEINNLRNTFGVSWNDLFEKYYSLSEELEITNNQKKVSGEYTLANNKFAKYYGQVPTFGGYSLANKNFTPEQEFAKPKSIPVNSELFEAVRVSKRDAHLSWNDIFLWFGAILSKF